MRTFLTLVRRELLAFFLSPMAYIFIICFLLMEGWWFNSLVTYFAKNAGMQASLFGAFMWEGFTPLYLLIIIPCITMKLLAEERRSGTIEVLMSAPVTDTQVVLSKFAGALLFYVLMWLPTLGHVAVLAVYGNPDWWLVASAYLGVFLFGMTLISMGLFCSATATSQIVAAIMAIALNFSFYFLIIQKDIDAEWLAQEIALGKWKVALKDVLAYMHFRDHGELFTKGLIDSRPLVFNASVSAFFLFLSVKVTESRRWR